MKQRVIWSTLMSLWVVLAYSQQSINDTIRIDEVKIVSSRLEHLTSNSRKERIDAKKLRRFPNNTISEVLQQSSALNIKANGNAGAISTLSLRGTGANHTQVNWNGFPINSVTLGSSDLSALPAGSFDQVSLVYGASGTLFGSGTFGGALNLNTDPRLVGEGLHASLSTSVGSWESYSVAAKIGYSEECFSYSGTIWGKSSEGNFGYYDYIGQQDKKRNNADWYNYGTIQQVGYRLSKTDYIDIGLWYQFKDVNLPSIVGSIEPVEEAQTDSTFKAFVRYRKMFSSSTLTTKVALFDDKTHYVKRIEDGADYSINSKIECKRLYADVNYRNYFSKQLSWDIGGTLSDVKANVLAYGREIVETDFAFVSALKYHKEKFSSQISVRKEWSSVENSDWLFAASVGYQLLPKRVKVVGAFSQKFRRPSFNDRYWIPGGNSDLLSEKGNSFDLNLEAIIIDGAKLKLKFVGSGYISTIDNMIVWLPDGAYWKAENYQNADIKGVDMAVQFDYGTTVIKLRSKLSLLLNDSKVSTLRPNREQQMLYSPKTTWSFNNQIAYKTVSFGLVNSFTAERYYDQRNVLDSFVLTNCWFEKKFRLSERKVDVRFKLNNLFDIEYELTRSYPMPGRNWELGLSYQF